MLTIVYLSDLCLWVYIIYMYKPPSYYWSGANIHHLSLFPSTSYSTSPPRPTPPTPQGRGYHPQTMGGVGGGGPRTWNIYIYTRMFKFVQVLPVQGPRPMRSTKSTERIAGPASHTERFFCWTHDLPCDLRMPCYLPHQMPHLGQAY